MQPPHYPHSLFVNLQPEYLNHPWYYHQRESLLDCLKQFNNEPTERSEIKPARSIRRYERSVTKAEIQPAFSIFVTGCGEAARRKCCPFLMYFRPESIRPSVLKFGARRQDQYRYLLYLA
jgi:hypothetical protein